MSSTFPSSWATIGREGERDNQPGCSHSTSTVSVPLQLQHYLWLRILTDAQAVRLSLVPPAA